MDSTASSSQSSSNSSISESVSRCYADVERSSISNLVLQRHSKHSTAPSRRSKSKSKTMLILPVVSLFISVLCLLCIGALFSWMFFLNSAKAVDPHTSRLKETEVCIPCLQMSPNPLESKQQSEILADLDVRFDEDTETRICCAVTPAQYANLFKLILQRQQEIKKIADSLDNDGSRNGTKTDAGTESPEAEQQTKQAARSVSAHLVLKPSQPTLSGSDNKPEQHWKSPAESPWSHVMDGLKFHDNRIFVLTPGLYYVYCQVLYSPSVTSLSDVVSTYVRRFNSPHSSSVDFLLKSRYTRHNENDRHSSYVGGVFRLNRGDNVFVQVSRPELVSHDDIASFFGMFKVGE